MARLSHDNQTSMLQTDQPMPRLGSQSGTVEQNPDGSHRQQRTPSRWALNSGRSRTLAALGSGFLAFAPAFFALDP